MVRKILLGIVALLILAGAGTYMLIKTKGDVLLQKFSAYVEETTVAGHNAVGGTPGTGDVQGDQEAADAVSDASKELAAA